MKSKNMLDLSRRGFLKWSAAAAALPIGLTGCGKSDNTEYIDSGTAAQDNPSPLLSGGKWVTIPCPECPKFRCVNRAYVVDGIPIRQKTQDDHMHTTDYPVFRACAKGRGMRLSIFSPDRLKYPMKRKHWNEGEGDKTPHLRGKDTWERISWDEAIRIVTSEFKRIGAKYIPDSEKFQLGVDTYPGTYSASTKYGKNLKFLNLCYTADREPRFLNYLGYGSMPMYGQNSPGGWPVVRNKIQGDGGISGDRFDVIEKAKVIVQWGQNHTWSSYGASQLTWRAAKERGAKVFCVDPWLTFGNNAWADEWIPVRPGTDSALLLAIAYVLIDENLVKTDFLFKHTLGYDADHMPIYDKTGNELTERVTLDANSGTFTTQSIVEATPGTGTPRNKYYKLNFKDYVLGTYDGTPKTPQWASNICGTPVDKIYMLARAMGNVQNPREELVFSANTSTGRHYHGATMAQTFTTVSWMLGGPIGDCFGGGSYSGAYHGYYPGSTPYFGQYSPFEQNHRSTYGLDFMTQRDNPKAAGAYGAIMNPSITIENNYNPNYFYGVAFAEVPRAVMEGKFHNFVHGEETCDIRAMIKLHNGNQSNQNVNTKAYIEAHRDPKVEFVVASDFFMSTETRYADIILPSTTWWENEGHYNMLNPEMFIGHPGRIVEPMFETKGNFEMDELFLMAVGADKATAKKYANPYGATIKEHVARTFLETWIKTPDGLGKQYLMSFDDGDLNELGIPMSTVAEPRLKEGLITYKEFKERGFYQARVNENTRQTMGAAVQAFLAETPVADNSKSEWMTKTNYLSTETGFYEIFSINLTNYYRNFWYDAPALNYAAENIGKEAAAKTSQLLYPIAVYRAQPDGYEDTLGGTYPLQYVNIHPHHRVHSQRTDNKGLLEVFDDCLYINPADAAAKNLKTGDTVILTSSNGGKIMRRVLLLDTVMKGVIIGTEGATVRHLDDEAAETPLTTDEWKNVIDYGGSSNVLTASYLVGQAHQAYNTIIVNMEKANVKLVPQYKWEPDLPLSDGKIIKSNYVK